MADKFSHLSSRYFHIISFGLFGIKFTLIQSCLLVVFNFFALKIQHGSPELQPEILVSILYASTTLSDCATIRIVIDSDQEILENGSDLFIFC